MMVERSTRELHELARSYGVQTAYEDVTGRRRRGAPEPLLAVLRALGAPVERPSDVPDALRERRRAHWRRGLEPVAVAWGGGPAAVELRGPAEPEGDHLRCRLELETGETRRWDASLAELPTAESAEIEGARYAARRLPLPERLPHGYHRIVVEWGGESLESRIISAPEQTWRAPDEEGTDRDWGVFLPLYALHSERSWGGGDLTDLGEFMGWVGQRDGGVVGTLPLLAAFLDTPFEPSPYAPASRLFWNELYLDPAAEAEGCAPAAAALESASLREEAAELRAAPLVDYRREAALKRTVLSERARCFFDGGGDGSDAFRRFLEERPRVEDYARFRATCERRGASWREWPERLREGTLEPGDYDEDAARYHTWVQWRLHRRLERLAESADARLYLDLPLGTHPDGYDIWRERELFASGASAGAPPDPFFEGGQDWGFPPLVPERMRERGYRYTIACIRNHLRYAGLLRLDHVMALHRLFWVPRGFDATDGVYVRYRPEELYAILCLESHRHRAGIVGEDLGTVPQEVRQAMARRGVQRMHVVQFEVSPDEEPPLPDAPRASIASLNTHDMPTFAGFWDESDPAVRRALEHALAPFLEGGSGMPAVLRASLSKLAAGPARLLLVNLEDLWLEPRPQNVPGTVDEYPNWRRKARYTLEEVRARPEVLRALQMIDRRRRGHGGRDG